MTACTLQIHYANMTWLLSAAVMLVLVLKDQNAVLVLAAEVLE